MFKESYNVIGTMSGTSLDGIDLAHIEFWTENNNWHFKIHQAITVSYLDYWLNKFKIATTFQAHEIEQLNIDYSIHLGGVIQKFITDHQIKTVDFVCSHGHTIWHQPERGITLQIGNLKILADTLNKKVICDFRIQDVIYGGQGAPLVPTGDYLLFRAFDYCLNLGGFSNISFQKKDQRNAFDICPVNTVLNTLVNPIGLPFDDQGKIARKGKIIEHLLEELNEIPFYDAAAPKSLGIEFVNQYIWPILEKYNDPLENKLHTFVIHIAMQIGRIFDANKKGKVLITGGGVYHTFLMEKINQYCPDTTIIIPNDHLIQYKEALIFAFLGVLRIRNEENIFAQVTGAFKNHSSGKIFNPN
jgi:anhydro-N-acetylmuramic acid kinase